MILLFDVLIAVPVLIALLFASLSDLKTREIPDWLSYGSLFYIFSARIIESLILRNSEFILQTTMVFAIFFAFGNLMYFTKQWGGGDTKLIAVIGSAFATTPSYINVASIVPFPAKLLLNILITGAIYGMLYALYLTIKHWGKFKREFRKLNLDAKTRSMKISMLSIALLIFITAFTFLPSELKHLGGLMSITILVIPYILIVLKAIELACMYKEIPVNKLTEGDWVQSDVYKNRRLIYQVSPYGIDKKGIELLKKEKIKSIVVSEGIPFVPPFFIGTVITLITGSALFFPLI